MTRGSAAVGRLEVCAGGLWGTVCGRGATNTIVKVVCRQLLHAAGGRCTFVNKINEIAIFSFLGYFCTESDFQFLFDGLVPIRRTNVVCTGSENFFSKCSFNGADGDQSCTHQDDMVVFCTRKYFRQTLL